MAMKVNIKKLSRMSVLLLIAFSVIALSGCGKPGTPPPGATLTIDTNGGPDHTAPLSPTDITTQWYRVTVVDASGIPLQGVTLDIQGSFKTGDNITLNNDVGSTSPQALGTIVRTGTFGFALIPISAPTFSFGTLTPPVATGATALASGGTITSIGTFAYGVTATDAATPPVETTISNIVSATTTTTIGSSITITWNAVSRASGYFVYGDGGTGGSLFKLFVVPMSSSSVCNALTLVCSFTDTTGLTGASPPPSTNLSGQGLNPVTGTLTVTTGALLTTLDIAQ
jgi:hypothetical protein